MNIAQAFPVGEHLADELEARGWSQAEFAEIIGRPVQFVSEIISGKRELTKEAAAQLASAFGMDAEHWLNLQTRYQVWLQEQDSEFQKSLSTIERKARQRDLAPVALLQKRGIISRGSLDEIDRELMDLYEISDFGLRTRFALAARKNDVEEELTELQLAWALSIRKKAKEYFHAFGEYKEDDFRGEVENLAEISLVPEEFEGLQNRFHQVGVGLFYVENFPGAKIDGACFMLEGHPIIGLSGRGKRLDKVLFTLCHEVGHVLNGDISENSFMVDENIGGGESNLESQEMEADGVASKLILKNQNLDLTPANIRSEWVKKEAERIGVHPIVVVGRLQNEGKLDWRTALAKNAPNVDMYMSAWK
ncbi:HigA family addiction module antitoxin [Rothia amarae]|uniref:HigA family addiction module antitoxin n=1 Tax=Rothia amarae TaxID=169480 RepID=UPI0031E1B37D